MLFLCNRMPILPHQNTPPVVSWNEAVGTQQRQTNTPLPPLTRMTNVARFCMDQGKLEPAMAGTELARLTRRTWKDGLVSKLRGLEPPEHGRMPAVLGDESNRQSPVVVVRGGIRAALPSYMRMRPSCEALGRWTASLSVR